MKIVFVPEGLVYLQIIFHNHAAFVTYIFWIVKRLSIHKLQLGFVNVFIAPIESICFTTLDVILQRVYS